MHRECLIFSSDQCCCHRDLETSYLQVSSVTLFVTQVLGIGHHKFCAFFLLRLGPISVHFSNSEISRNLDVVLIYYGVMTLWPLSTIPVAE